LFLYDLIGCYYPADVWHTCVASGPHTAVLNPLEDAGTKLSLPLVLASMLSGTTSVPTATIDTNIAKTARATIVFI
jgi:hypothetical protein